jgi:hypothetical protein
VIDVDKIFFFIVDNNCLNYKIFFFQIIINSVQLKKIFFTNSVNCEEQFFFIIDRLNVECAHGEFGHSL